MIKINLLPQDLQRAANTPRSVFYSVLGSVAAVALGAIGLFWMWIAQGTMEAHAEAKAAKVKGLEEEALEVDRIQSDIQFYRQREGSIIKIKNRRILWAPKLDQLVSKVPEDLWITSLQVNLLEENEYKWVPGSQQSGGTLVMDCVSTGSDPVALTRFRKSLQEDNRFYTDLVDVSAFPDSFFGDFLNFKPLSWEKVEKTEDAPEHFRSSIGIDLKPLHDPPVANPGQKGGQ